MLKGELKTKVASHCIGRTHLSCVVKVFKKRVLGLIKRSYDFDRYLGVTLTASLRLPHHYSITAIATVTSFYTGLKVSIALFIADLFPVSILLSHSKKCRRKREE